MQNAPEIWQLVADRRDRYTALADDIWDHPELNYAEEHAAAAHAAALRAEGFRVTTGVADIPTAMVGEAGEGGPVIAILGEYDALPGLSQVAGIAEPRPLVAGGSGHGCGHNLLGAGSLMAAAAVKDWLARHHLPGRVRYYGCPAEEGGSAKGFMVHAGLFRDVDIAICWHPAVLAGVNNPISLACAEMFFHFTGRASHAAAAPHLGRSALDAVELLNVGVNYMREHMPSTARIHYAYADAGGIAPNVVQAHATVRYLVRARDLATLQTLIARVKKIAEGAALMTETAVTCEFLSADANLVGNDPLEAAMHAELERLGPPQYDAADQAFAHAIQATLTLEDQRATLARFGQVPRPGVALCDGIFPPESGDGTLVGSTDVGSVSWVVPTVQVRGATWTIGTPGHSWQATAQGKSGIAHKGMEHAAKVIAATAVRLFEDKDLLAAAKADLARRLEETPYADPIPPDAKPPLPPKAAR